MTVLESISKIINEKIECGTYPFCALFFDVRRLCNISDAEFTEEIKRLKTDGKIIEKQTINSASYYLSEET